MPSLKEKLQALPEISKLQLLDLLNNISGKKDLILHENILSSLNRIVNIHDLRSRDVDKIFKLDLNNMNISVENSTGVIIIYNELSYIRILCNQISSELRKKEKDNLHMIKYHLVIIPQVSSALEILIEEEGLYEVVDLHSFLWQPILLDDNIVALDLPNVFSSLFLKRNLSIVSSLTKSLQHFFSIFGKPKVSFIHGETSNDIYSGLHKSCFEQNICSDIDYFLMYDRNVDYASVLQSPVTYAGLLDQIFGEKIEFDNGTVINKSTDPIYKELKYKNFIDVSNYLKENTKFIQNEQNKYKNNMSIPELKRFINDNLKSLLELKKQIASHIAACETILNSIGEFYGEMNELENYIANDLDKNENYEHVNNMICSQKLSKETALRLLCFVSNQGISLDIYNEMKTNYLNTYGYEHLFTFYNLEKNKLFNKKSSMNMTQMLNNELKTIFNKLKSTNEVSITNTGTNRYYICKIIELIVNHNFTVEKLSRMFPSCCQHYINDDVNMNSKDKLNFVIYVVGGISYNEIASLCLLEKTLNVNIIVNASNIINGNDLIKQCMSL